MNVLKYVHIIFLMCFCNTVGYCQTILQPGDVAVIGYNFKDPDQFSFLFLKDVAAGTVVHITDCGYDPALTGFRVGEGDITYTVPRSGIKAGVAVTYPDDAGFVTAGISGFFGLSTDGDQLFFYQGSFTAPAFIYGLSVSSGGWDAAAVDNNTSALPPGLTDGITALAQTKIVNSRLNCTGVAIDKSLFLNQISDMSKWDRSNSTRVSLPDITCDYTPLTLHLPHFNNDIESNEKEVLIEDGYWKIEIYSAEGILLLTVSKLEEAFINIIKEKMYIFKVYYPDRLKVVKILMQ